MSSIIMQITWVRFDKILSTIGYRYACVYWVRWQSNGKYGRELRIKQYEEIIEHYGEQSHVLKQLFDFQPKVK